MKKLLIFIAFLALPISNVFAQSDDDYQLIWEANSLKEYSEGAAIGSVTAGFLEWPTDDNGEITALVRIRIENMAIEDAQDLKARVSTGLAQLKKQEFHGDLDVPELWLYVSPESFSVDLFGDGYKSRPYDIERKLESRHIYSLTLHCVKQIAVSLATIPQEINIYIDGKRVVDNKARLTSGRHKVSFTRNGSDMHRDTTITVSEQNYNFRFDLRERYSIHVTSDPSGADVYVRVRDKDEYFGPTPTDVSLPEGSYRMVTKYGFAMADTTLLNVSPNNRSVNITLEQKKRIELHAVYQGRRTAANIHIRRIDGRYVPDQNETSGARQSFSLNLPYGRYEVSMSNDKNTATRVIGVRENSSNTYEFNIKPPKKKLVWPWERDFDQRIVGISIGYAFRQIVASDDAHNKLSFDQAWGMIDGHIGGIRAGIHLQPCFDWGLGFYSGVFFDYYYSSSPQDEQTYSDNGPMEDWFSSYSTKAISVPLHIYYRLPFSEEFAFSFHGGLDIDYMFGTEYKDNASQAMTYTPEHGDGLALKRFNFGYSVGVGIQYDWAMLEFSWKYGLTNHEITDYVIGATATKWEGFNISFSILIE